MHPMADYAAKEMKLKRIATISEDFAFGHERWAASSARSRTQAASREETLAANRHTGLHALHRADCGLRRCMPGLRRIESAALPEAAIRQRI